MRPTPIRFLSQDFPGETQTWISRLIVPLNHFMTSVNTALNKGLTFRDHMNAEIKTITVTCADSLIVSCNLKSRPIGVLILHSEQELKSPLTLDWTGTEGGIKIRKVLGLENNKTYTLTLLVIGG